MKQILKALAISIGTMLLLGVTVALAQTKAADTHGLDTAITLNVAWLVGGGIVAFVSTIAGVKVALAGFRAQTTQYMEDNTKRVDRIEQRVDNCVHCHGGK